MEKRLYRTKKNRVIAGVLGGFAEYFRMDPTVLRIAYVAACVVISPIIPLAVAAYIIAAMVMPQGRENAYESNPNSQEQTRGPVSGFSNGSASGTGADASAGYTGGGYDGGENKSSGAPDIDADEFSKGLEDWRQPSGRIDTDKSKKAIGMILVSIGVLFVAKQFFNWFNIKYILPLVFVGIGAWIIYKGGRNSV